MLEWNMVVVQTGLFVRENKLTMLRSCPRSGFVHHWIQQHPRHLLKVLMKFRQTLGRYLQYLDKTKWPE